jgi:hypothetical protein
MEKLLGIYESILRYTGLECNADGFVSIKVGDSTEPILVNGKRLVLPTRHILAGSTENVIVFHPLAENILGEESVVLTHLRALLNKRINTVFSATGLSLLNLAASAEQHKRLNMDQLKFVTDMGDVTRSTIDEYTQLIIAGLKENVSSLFVNIYLKRGGTYRNERYSYVGITTSTIKKKLAEDTLIYGVKIKDTNKVIISKLIDYLIPELDVPERYNFPTTSKVAPRLDCLLRTSLLMASWLNTALETFGDLLPDLETLPFDANWVEAFDDLESLVETIRSVPSQGGQLKTLMAPMQQALPAPVTRQEPAPRQEYLRTPVTIDQPPVGNGVVSTNKGIDFAATLNNNPALDPRRMAPVHQTQYMPQQPMPVYAMPAQQVHPLQVYPPQQIYQQPNAYQQYAQQPTTDIYGRVIQPPQQTQQIPPGYAVDQMGRLVPMQPVLDTYGLPIGYSNQMAVPPGYPQMDNRQQTHPITGLPF